MHVCECVCVCFLFLFFLFTSGSVSLSRERTVFAFFVRDAATGGGATTVLAAVLFVSRVEARRAAEPRTGADERGATGAASRSAIAAAARLPLPAAARVLRPTGAAGTTTAAAGADCV